MRHHLKTVASNFSLDAKKLTEFALKNPTHYGIDDDKGFVTTSTWFTKQLVEDFKAFMNKENYQPCHIFYMKEMHYLRFFGTNDAQKLIDNIDSLQSISMTPESAKKVLEDIQKIELPLHDKFKHWGVVFQKLDFFLPAHGIGVVFFTGDKMNTDVFTGYRENLKDFEQLECIDAFTQKMEQFVRNYDPATKK